MDIWPLTPSSGWAQVKPDGASLFDRRLEPAVPRLTADLLFPLPFVTFLPVVSPRVAQLPGGSASNINIWIIVNSDDDDVDDLLCASGT